MHHQGSRIVTTPNQDRNEQFDILDHNKDCPKQTRASLETAQRLGPDGHYRRSSALVTTHATFRRRGSPTERARGQKLLQRSGDELLRQEGLTRA